MSIFFATVRFTDPGGREGRSDWAVEASDDGHALSLIRHRLTRDGRQFLSASLAEKQPGGVFAGVGSLDMLHEGPVHWTGQPDDSAVQISETMPQQPGTGWIDPAFWNALFRNRGAERVYAVIDPHLWPSQHGSLPEDIAAAGLPSACLFDLNGDPGRAESAPWLIELPMTGNEPPLFAPTSLHRRAFAKGAGPGSPLFLRSPLPLEQMRQRLRKLTRVQDTDGKWYFNRFWEPEFFLYFMLFLEGRRMLAPLADLTGFALASEGRIITARTDLRNAPDAAPDRAGDLDLLFEAGTAMVALRHARRLETEFLKGCNADIVYALAKERFGLMGMDYRFVMKCVDISYSMLAFFSGEAGDRLADETVRSCFDDSGQLSPQVEVLHGLCMFALRHGIPPDMLHSEVRFGS